MRLTIVAVTLAICRMEPEQEMPDWARQKQALFSITRTDEELSLVCEERLVPPDVTCERGWRALKVQGPLDFALTGILAALATPLAQGGIPIFALSTFETDYILLKELYLSRAQALLQQEGHTFSEDGSI